MRGEHRPEAVDSKTTIMVQVVFVKPLPPRGRLPGSALHILKDDQERKVVWFARDEELPDDMYLEGGKWYVLDCTIQKKDIYKGEKSTIVKRCKVVEGPLGDPSQSVVSLRSGATYVPIPCTECKDRTGGFCNRYSDDAYQAIHTCVGLLSDTPDEDLYTTNA